MWGALLLIVRAAFGWWGVTEQTTVLQTYTAIMHRLCTRAVLLPAFPDVLCAGNRLGVLHTSC
jgi:hypothetical protein